MVDVCTYQKSKFKGLDAIVLENERVRAVILPEYGGKMVSFFDKEVEYEWLYQTQDSKLQVPPYGANFSDYNSSGFDELFSCLHLESRTNGEEALHGEVWMLPWEYKATYEGVALQVHSPEFPYSLSKNICLHSEGITIKYEAMNKSDEAFPFIWSPHALLKDDADTEIKVPGDMEKGMQQKEGETTNTDSDRPSLRAGATVNPSQRKPVESATVEKFRFTEPLEEGWCSLVQPNVNRKLTYRFPQKNVPYLSVKRTRGEHIALAPSTGVYDSDSAEKSDQVSFIPAQGVYTWTFNMEVKDHK
ncbi:Aldose 1-epimerase [Halobacillus dabanensis]|uniref:Aldose 1-epimerase n=1 Tax=Halobacillus dabanensis TaxID=240302 RepID=A0A1I3XB66_HALDA|nr:DUF5107 domain-containing protein [Halobacillus dabanensis]SFK16803.1 Aldose 1-epimerase [Halobacillus dabanensis]